MRLVVDTNVFVNAALRTDSLPFLVVRWIDQHGGLLKSAATENELLDVLRRPRIAALTVPGFREGVARMPAMAERVTITERIALCRDPKDNKFLELALSGGAGLIVSGDGDLRALSPFRGIPVITPAVFVQSIAP
jgi:putative PIN family toxin of toxin-antitoxin system